LKPNLFKEYLESIGFKLLTTLTAHPLTEQGKEPKFLSEKESKPLIVYQKVSVGK
jgi:hypothetical protein